MKFGYEREFFIHNGNGEFVISPRELPHDDCGWLAEIRGEPGLNPGQTLGNYIHEELRVRRQAAGLGLFLVCQDSANLPKELITEAFRVHGANKHANDQGSMYGKFWKEGIQRAGLHIHFSNEIKISVTLSHEKEVKVDKKRFRIETETRENSTKASGFIDMVKFIYGLDKLFEEEIKAAKRVPGLYEIKDHGFEYRSLPTTVSMEKVTEALYELLNERWTAKMQEKFAPKQVVVKDQ